MISLKEAIDLLESDVIGELTRNNIKGNHGRCNCPVAQYFYMKTGARAKSIQVTQFLICDLATPICTPSMIETPSNISNFIEAYDHGTRPEFDLEVATCESKTN